MVVETYAVDYPEWCGRFAAVLETIVNFEEWGISRDGAVKLARQALDDYARQQDEYARAVA